MQTSTLAHRGFVFFITHPQGFVRIGHTEGDPRIRLCETQCHCPYQLELKAAIKHRNSPELARVLQQSLTDKCEHGEWFRLSDSELEQVLAGLGVVTPSGRENSASETTPGFRPELPPPLKQGFLGTYLAR